MHTPVLLNELVKAMNIKPDGTYIDCTGGGGGHASAVLSELSSFGRLIILDRDPDAVNRLKSRFENDLRVMVFNSNFSKVDEVMRSCGIDKADGIYADFGISSFQIEDSIRGFSFRKSGPIDMRMDKGGGVSAYDVVNTFTQENIAVIISRFGEEKFAQRISAEIVRRRAIKKFTDTCELAEAIKNAVPKKFHIKDFHPATKTFQALRIFVNGELEAIRELMIKIGNILNSGGRFSSISFHSLEDRIVKNSLTEYTKTCICPPHIPVCVCNKKQEFKILTKKPVTPSEEEIRLNPLSRSAKLRAAERL